MEFRALEITPVIGCSVACTYCPQRLLQRSYLGQKQMTFEDYKQFLSTVPPDVAVHFTGKTEPFLHPEIHLFIQHAWFRGHRLALSTTLVGADSEKLRAISSMAFRDGFVLHLPSNDWSMNIDVTQDYIELVAFALKICPVGAVQIFGQPHPSLVELLAERNTSHWPMNNRAGNLPILPAPRSGNCDRLKINGLLPNGDVVLCCHDYGLQHVIGNLNTDSYDDLHKSVEWLRIIGREGATLCDTCHESPTVGQRHDE